MNILYQNSELTLTYQHERVFLTDKLNNVLYEKEFYGNASCGLIDSENKWVLIGGEHLTFWTRKRISIIKADEFQWIHSLRTNSKNTVAILTDPWYARSAIWQLDTCTLDLMKIQNFPDYRDQQYTDTIEW
ncbi:hypothetical protein SAMN05421741_12930 [Paenimyroides ummariense]|uniref:Uncharacterized protein n=1 Tax=Paenimyroides ummariense TaxID=913024 RepID=A0A1I5FLA5_9FLAO|nr:hypothetical protein [Paenimyroides ummariense]SFO24550.1 hypothetical protein SAMN05421741_12930 [Paenimyroides ummariense]